MLEEGVSEELGVSEEEGCAVEEGVSEELGVSVEAGSESNEVESVVCSMRLLADGES